MRRSVVDIAITAALATIVLGAILAFVPVRHGLALDVYVIVIGALAVAAGASLTRAAAHHELDAHPVFDRALAHEEDELERPAQLLRIEREVHLGVANALYFHTRLCTTLRSIAVQRLRTRRGLELDAAAPETLEALGPAWDAVRPDRPPPEHRDARGIPFPELHAVVDALERI